MHAHHFHLSFLPQKKQAPFLASTLWQHLCFVGEGALFRKEEQTSMKGHKNVFIPMWLSIIVKAKRVRDQDYRCFQDLLLHGKTFFLQVTHYS